ncbi:MAG: hypothetical protein LBT33_06220, partial [Spirochaetia bacterium]|nr:hypothetical protein [Spirochaetia bacterium]
MLPKEARVAAFIFLGGVIVVGVAHFFAVKPQKNRAFRGCAIAPAAAQNQAARFCRGKIAGYATTAFARQMRVFITAGRGHRDCKSHLRVP